MYFVVSFVAIVFAMAGLAPLDCIGDAAGARSAASQDETGSEPSTSGLEIETTQRDSKGYIYHKVPQRSAALTPALLSCPRRSDPFLWLQRPGLEAGHPCRLGN